MSHDDNRSPEFYRLTNIREGVVDQHFGRAVRARREALGWSQERLAAALTSAGFPMHQTTVAKIEQATRPARITELFAIALVLEVRVVDLLGMTDLDDPITVEVKATAASLRGARDELVQLSKSIEKRKSALDKNIEDLER